MARRRDDSFLDFALRRQLEAASYGNSVAVEKLLPALRLALRDVTDRLDGYSQPNFTRARMEVIRRELEQAIRKLEVAYSAELTKASVAVFRDEFDKGQRELNALAGRASRKLPYSVPVEDIVAYLDAPIVTGDAAMMLGDYISRNMAGLENATKSQLTQSLALGETNAQAAARLRAIPGSEITKRGAKMLARTAMNAAGNRSREALYAANSDIIRGFRAVGTLDIRICERCAPWDGREATKRADLPNFPLHPNCRCTVVALTVFDDEEGDTRPAVTDQSEKVTEHRDGTTSTKWKVESAKQVSAKTTFRDFFERQPEAWKRKWLGEGKYELWKRGKLSLNDLATQDRILSLSELKGGA